MPNEAKGITVKIDAGLHAQVREYVESHGMTMAEFVSRALDNELFYICCVSFKSELLTVVMEIISRLTL